MAALAVFLNLPLFAFLTGILVKSLGILNGISGNGIYDIALSSWGGFLESWSLHRKIVTFLFDIFWIWTSVVVGLRIGSRIVKHFDPVNRQKIA